MDSMDYFFEIYSSELPRQGPGDHESTLRAYKMLSGLPAHPKILDIGCGTGEQTLDLARVSNGSIIAIDFHQPFLDELERKASRSGLSGFIQTRCLSMDSLDYPPGSFDILWSEGSIYIIGFEKGLRGWMPLLKPGGYLAVSEAAWIKPDPPDEIRNFWETEYPGISTVGEKIAVIDSCGYKLVGHFTLPESAWWDYYHPIERRCELFHQKYAANPDALKILEMTRREIDMYRKYSAWYSYEFFVMRKP